MANLINTTYFANGIDLPQRADDEINSVDINAYIEQYEPEFLQRAWGYSFYKLYTANSSAQRFQDLVGGKDYVVDGITYRWNGLINSQKISPIAYYVYWMYRKYNATHTANTAETVSNVENSTTVSPIDKQVAAWREMVKLVKSMYAYLHANADTYPEWDASYADCDLIRYQNFMNI